MTDMTTRDFATAIGTDPKTLRKFLRDSTPRDEHPGKGGRWTLKGDKRTLTTARKSFAKWQKDQADKAAERAAIAAKDATEAVDALEGLDEDPEGTDTPTDEDAHNDATANSDS
jgi:hypothetical protein